MRWCTASRARARNKSPAAQSLCDELPSGGRHARHLRSQGTPHGELLVLARFTRTFEGMSPSVSSRFFRRVVFASVLAAISTGGFACHRRSQDKQAGTGGSGTAGTEEPAQPATGGSGIGSGQTIGQPQTIGQSQTIGHPQTIGSGPASSSEKAVEGATSASAPSATSATPPASSGATSPTPSSGTASSTATTPQGASPQGATPPTAPPANKEPIKPVEGPPGD